MVILSSDRIEVTLAAPRGGKITGLLHRDSGRQWLEDAAAVLDGPPDLSRDFDHGDMCGWDEMLPTVEACVVEGQVLADHGELWRRPWEVLDQSGPTVTMRCDDRGGLVMTRRLVVEGSRLSVDYGVVNEGEVDRSLLWAAHPLFRHRAGTRIAVTGDVVELADDGLRVLGPWPGALSSPDELGVGECAKFFVRVDAPVASLIDAEGTWLTMTWDAEAAPYLGVWLDQRAYARHAVVALEPTNVAHDSLEVALRAGAAHSAWRLSPGQERRWSLSVELGASGTRPTRTVARQES